MTTFLMIRHAMTELVDKALAGWTPGVHLSGEGLKQAQRLAQRLAEAPIAAIYSSPLERARETAAAIAQRVGLEVQPSEGLGEIRFGEWTGREIKDLLDMPKWQQFNSYRSGTRIPEGELMIEAQARIVAELERLRERHPNDLVAAVSHSDLIKAAIAHYAGIHLDLFHRIEISPASISIIALNDYGPQIIRINDTGELPEF